MSEEVRDDVLDDEDLLRMSGAELERERVRTQRRIALRLGEQNLKLDAQAQKIDRLVQLGAITAAGVSLQGLGQLPNIARAALGSPAVVDVLRALMRLLGV